MIYVYYLIVTGLPENAEPDPQFNGTDPDHSLYLLWDYIEWHLYVECHVYKPPQLGPG